MFDLLSLRSFPGVKKICSCVISVAERDIAYIGSFRSLLVDIIDNIVRTFYNIILSMLTYYIKR